MVPVDVAPQSVQVTVVEPEVVQVAGVVVTVSVLVCAQEAALVYVTSMAVILACPLVALPVFPTENTAELSFTVTLDPEETLEPLYLSIPEFEFV